MHFPLKYLGLPLSIFKLRRQDILPLIDKFSSKLKGWKSKLLAPAGRVALTSSVLLALPMHFLSVIPLPVWALKIIDRRCRAFVWKGEEEINEGHCLIPWARVCRSKEWGGLGLLNLKDFGIALGCRWQWLRWDAEECPWQLFPDQQDKDAAAILAAAGRVTLGRGDTARFWTDNWTPEGRSIASLAPALFSFVKDSKLSVRDALHNRRWLKDIQGGLTVQAVVQYLWVWDMARATVLDSEAQDRLEWRMTEHRQFTVSSAYKMFFMAGIRFACYKPLWKSKAPPRCKFFMWLVIHRKCLTAENL